MSAIVDKSVDILPKNIGKYLNPKKELYLKTFILLLSSGAAIMEAHKAAMMQMYYFQGKKINLNTKECVELQRDDVCHIIHYYLDEEVGISFTFEYEANGTLHLSIDNNELAMAHAKPKFKKECYTNS